MEPRCCHSNVDFPPIPLDSTVNCRLHNRPMHNWDIGFLSVGGAHYGGVSVIDRVLVLRYRDDVEF